VSKKKQFLVLILGTVIAATFGYVLKNTQGTEAFRNNKEAAPALTQEQISELRMKTLLLSGEVEKQNFKRINFEAIETSASTMLASGIKEQQLLLKVHSNNPGESFCV